MKKLFIFLSILVSVIFLASCSIETVKITGSKIEKEIEANEIEKLNVDNIRLRNNFLSSGPKIEIKDSDKKSIIISMQESLQNELDISTKSNELTIEGSHFKEYETDYELVITISGYKLSSFDLAGQVNLEAENNTLSNSKLSIKLSGASKFKAETINVNDLDLKLSGASKIEFDEVNAKNTDIEISGASNIKINAFNVTNIEAEVSGASNLEFDGNVDTFNIEISGASTLSDYDLKVNKLYLDVSGASTIKVSVNQLLDGNISGASTLNYKGNPELKVESSGASKINNVN